MTAVAPDLNTIVVERVVATGILRLVTAAHFGGGEGVDTDLAVLRDGAGDLVIPGASIAGAARAYLHGRALPRAAATNPTLEAHRRLVDLLFGFEPEGGDRPRRAGRVAEEGGQSLLIVDDAYPPVHSTPATARRDGVKIENASATAADEAKYDYEVIEPGTTFALRLELAFPGDTATTRRADDLLGLFDALLDGFAAERIRVGARTRRGLGRAKVDDWQVRRYRMTGPGDRAERLRHLHDWLTDGGAVAASPRARTSPATTIPVVPTAVLEGMFELAGPLLVRSVPRDPRLPDAVHLRAGGTPIMPGTGLAGALRHRARRIVLTLAHAVSGGTWDAAAQLADEIVDAMFGTRQELVGARRTPDQRASRLQVEEEAVTDTFARVQHRIRIDRFTGGVQQGALFDEMPEWPRQPGAGRYRINLRLADPPPHEIDLLLLLFKDLWTGDLALGGEAGIGRGRLRGISGGLEVTGAGAWNWTAPPPALWDTAPFVFADEAARAGLRDRYEGKLWAELQRRVAGG